MLIISQAGVNKSIPVDMLSSAMHISRATYYRQLKNYNDAQDEPKTSNTPVNALNDKEKRCVLDLLHGAHFVDKTPYDVYYELIASRPNEVWSWDITKLLGPTKWVYYHLYVIMDIYSRYVVGWLIADCESQELARKLIQETALKQGVQHNQLTIHADNGPSMKSHTVAQLLEHLGVAKTHNRPYTSNDNPFSESHFKTLKYRPEFPVRCQSLQHGEAFCQQFFPWYNKEHYHSGIAWLTPESVHYHRDQAILEKRHAVLMQAFLRQPGRFNHKQPQLKKLPKTVYINPP
jgi:hypothetical protein